MGSYLRLHDLFSPLGLMGVFIGGFFYAYGFTAAPATAILLTLAKQRDIISLGIIGGFGALLGDIVIFQLIKNTFVDEMQNLKHELLIIRFSKLFQVLFGSISAYLVLLIAGLLIASPLPTEIGITLLAMTKKITFKMFLIFVYLLHSIGIFLVLLFGRLL